MKLSPRPSKPLGIYVHFPYCLHRCPYCDFNIKIARVIPHKKYAEAILTELRARKRRFQGRNLVSIYFGGGTPGLWEPRYIREVVQAIRDEWPVLADPVDVELAEEDGSDPLEITVEINPRRAPEEHLQALVDAGVNRLSVGVQSFDDDYLKVLGRDHSAEAAKRTLEAAHRAGFGRMSLDLIYAGPGQSATDLALDLDMALSMKGVDHVSAYCLAIEPGTPFGRKLDLGRMSEPPEELTVEMFRQCDAHLHEAGFLHYEIASHARRGRYARHNGLYWSGAEWMGLGVGAHEFAIVDGVPTRRENAADLRSYFRDPVGSLEGEDALDMETHLFERVFLGLRTRFGVSREGIGDAFGAQGIAFLDRCLEIWSDHQGVERAGEDASIPGYLYPGGDRWVPTVQGMLRSEHLAEMVLPDG